MGFIGLPCGWSAEDQTMIQIRMEVVYLATDDAMYLARDEVIMVQSKCSQNCLTARSEIVDET